MKPNHPEDRRSAEQAAQWLYRARGGGAREREGFADWLLESRRNVRQSLLALALDRELAQVDPQRQLDVQAMLKEGAGDVIELDPGAAGRGMPHNRGKASRWLLAAAAVAAGAIGLSFVTRAPVFSTATGEQQSVKLDDGSIVHLNTQSKIRVSFSEGERGVELLAGEALFGVESDATRPFRVHVGKTVVQVLGTQFNIDRHGPVVMVSVLDGSVRVSGAAGAGKVVTAGQEARIAADGWIEVRRSQDIRRRTAWRERRLEFQEDSLGTAVAEFNRYNRTPQLRIEGLGLGERKYTGIFSADDPESLAQLLSQEKDLALERTNKEIVIRQR